MPLAASPPSTPAMRSTSAGEAPAEGSSTSSTRGPAASAEASISSRCSLPLSSVAGRRPPRRDRPAQAASAPPRRASRVASRAFGVASRSRTTPPGRPCRPAPTAALSSTVRSPKSAVACSVRTIPAAPARAGCPAGAPRRRADDTLVGGHVPARSRSAVVLPEPFGPMSAVTVPASSVRSSPSTATSPPKRLLEPARLEAGRPAAARAAGRTTTAGRRRGSSAGASSRSGSPARRAAARRRRVHRACPSPRPRTGPASRRPRRPARPRRSRRPLPTRSEPRRSGRLRRA